MTDAWLSIEADFADAMAAAEALSTQAKRDKARGPAWATKAAALRKLATPDPTSLPYGLSSNPADYGPRPNLPARQSRPALTITTPGTVVENVDTPSIVVKADNVTVRNCRVIGSNKGGALLEYRTSKNVVIEDCYFDGTVNGQPGAYQAVHGWGQNATVRRCEAVGCANGVEIGGSGLVEWCHVHDLWQVPGTQQHPDGLQVDGGGPYIFRNNYVDVGQPPAGAWQTSAIGMWAVLANLTDCLVTNNVIGPCFPGYLFYCGVIASPFAASNVRFVDNVILRKPQGDEYGVWFDSASNPMKGTHAGNVYADGTPAD